LSEQEKRTLIATGGGWSVDAFDFMIYTFVIPALIAAWGTIGRFAGSAFVMVILAVAFLLETRGKQLAVYD
jgi:uncharacterized membrane protein